MRFLGAFYLKNWFNVLETYIDTMDSTWEKFQKLKFSYIISPYFSLYSSPLELKHLLCIILYHSDRMQMIYLDIGVSVLILCPR